MRRVLLISGILALAACGGEKAHTAPTKAFQREGVVFKLEPQSASGCKARGPRYRGTVQWQVPAAEKIDLELRVRAPDGASMLFRFYDPRAFRTVIPVLDPPARREFFGPIHGVYVEGRTPDCALFFARDGRPEPQALPLSTAA